MILKGGDEEVSEEDAATIPEGRRVEDEEDTEGVNEDVDRVEEEELEIVEDVTREELLEET